MSDPEGQTFAAQIDDILKAAGWSTTGVSQGAFAPHNPMGIFIIVHNAKTAPPYAAFLQRAFDLVGVPLLGEENTQIPEGKVQIIVGNKP